MEIFKKKQRKKRVIVYIDGFNLYFGMTSKYKNVKWLDLISLANNLLKPNQELVEVRYYTARISNNPPKVKRQSKYIDVLVNSGIIIKLGRYLSKPKFCRNCKATWKTYEEKMTDVNISVDLLIDAMNNRYDIALLISGDSDLVPPVKAIHTSFPSKRVVVAFPPNRVNGDVKRAAKGSFVIGRKRLTDSQFTDKVVLRNGIEIEKPIGW